MKQKKNLLIQFKYFTKKKRKKKLKEKRSKKLKQKRVLEILKLV